MKQWDNIYKKSSDYGYYNLFEPHEDILAVAARFKAHKVKRILDLGCGAGRNLIYLLKIGFDTYGIDLAPEGLELLNKQLKTEGLNTEVILGNVFEKLPYEDNFFDAVISVQVLQHGTEAKIKKVIAEIERVLKPGGIVFITLCGRLLRGEVRFCLVKTAKEIAPHTYTPTKGDEKGLPHFIYTKRLIRQHYKDFEITDIWKDKRDYYCFIGKLKFRKLSGS